MRRKALFYSSWIIPQSSWAGLGQFQLWAKPLTGWYQPDGIDRIVRTFTAKETSVRNALTLTLQARCYCQSLGIGGQITGEYHRVSYFTFDDSGNRFEKISFFPMPHLAA